MKKLLASYLLVSSLIIIGIMLFNGRQILAADTVMTDTTGFTTEDCKRGCGDKIDDPKVQACKQYCGEYGLNDFVLLGIKLTKIMLGLVGTLAFGAFVYGGVMFLISAGDADKVKKGKHAMTSAVVGLVIVFSSYLIIQFTLQTLGYLKPTANSTEPVDTKNFGNSWNEVPAPPKK
ncbi:pilin [Candidatus Parcubacteria bacterium]|nr:pilin [Patescibacteria group bacterium]MBU4309595.1 pilin [Patescibacteria group bacterium]MBU4432619.1 pilin [Patescibacteria group bacterium]MBU4578017.1 pilin [Patescibacteria group bacterium]MCG2696475.1 pilin [Candidatus Parcubacteria bacterium]